MRHANENRKESDLQLRLQDKFDLRYVLREGEYWIIRALVLGIAALALTAVASLLLGIAHLPVHTTP